MNDNVTKIMQGLAGLVGELDNLGVTKPKPAVGDDAFRDTIDTAFTEYQQKRAAGTDVIRAADRLVYDVAQALGRSLYEHETWERQ